METLAVIGIALFIFFSALFLGADIESDDLVKDCTTIHHFVAGHVLYHCEVDTTGEAK